MSDPSDPTPALFEVHHGSTVVRIADDWSGHVLIERLYTGLRAARAARDSGSAPLPAAAPGSGAESETIEAALFHGFRRVDDTPTYQATAEQIAALIRAAREEGRIEGARGADPKG